ncbi:MAG: hypothetical protein Q7T80_03805 [Methanoregula sp.]|nr:hypothetical protein [Methanoregula sp.]
MITEGHSASVACVGYPRKFPPAIPAVFVVGLMIMVVVMGAVVVFGEMMIRAEDVPAPPTRIGNFVENFPTKVATEH